MFYVNGNPLLVDELELLNELKNQLAINGIDKFREFKPGTSNIQFSCPIHNDGQESKPSCGITTVNKEKVPSGTVHCFTCGYTESLEVMISHCFGKDDLGRFGRDWLVKNFLTIEVEQRKKMEFPMNRNTAKAKKIIKYISEDELDKYRYIHPYMYKRGLTDEVIERFDIGYDPHFVLANNKGANGILRCLTFPVRDKTGNTLFIARRSVDIKLFHYPDGVDKPVYGLYELPDILDEVIICESFLNALTCYVHGKVGVALMGLGTEAQYEQLKRINCRKFITALDPDKAGAAATQKLKKALAGKKLVTSYKVPDKRDINDLTKEEFDNLEEIF